MAHEEKRVATSSGFSFFTVSDTIPQPRAAIVLVHGLGEHQGRYNHVVTAFNKAGFSVYRFDLPGHGKTGGTLGHIPSYDLAMEIITTMLDIAQKENPGLPRFLYGHSLGGNIVLYYSIQKKPALKGLIVTSPGLGTAEPVPAWKTMLGRILYNMLPTFAFGNGLDMEGLSHDPAVVSAYRADPLVHGKVTARLGMDLVNNGVWIQQHAADFPSEIPLLLMQGSQDRLVNPKITAEFAKNVPGKITFKMWDGLYHELHNEPQKAEVISTMITWMDQLLMD